MRILITNTAALNGGDAAILLATMAVLRRTFGDPVQFAVYDQQAEAAARYYGDIALHPTLYDQVVGWAGGGLRLKLAGFLVLGLARLRWPRLWRFLPRKLEEALRQYRDADLVVSAGGTYLVPDYRLTPKLFDFAITLALGRPLVLFTQSIGSFPRGRSRTLLRLILSRTLLILLRDEQSQQNVLAIGVRGGRTALCSDVAFALDAPDSAGEPAAHEGRLRIAVSVRDWPHFHSTTPEAGMTRFLDAVAAVTEAAVTRHRAEVVFISTCQGVPEYWTDDSRVGDRVRQRLPEQIRSRVTVDPGFHTPQQLLVRLADFDVAIATRMHACILALCAGVPVLPIAYEFKTMQLAEQLGLGSYTQDIETMTADGLLHAFENFIADRSAIAKSLRSLFLRERASAVSAGRLVRDALVRS